MSLFFQKSRRSVVAPGQARVENDAVVLWTSYILHWLCLGPFRSLSLHSHTPYYGAEF